MNTKSCKGFLAEFDGIAVALFRQANDLARDDFSDSAQWAAIERTNSPVVSFSHYSEFFRRESRRTWDIINDGWHDTPPSESLPLIRGPRHRPFKLYHYLEIPRRRVAIIVVPAPADGREDDSH